MMKYHATQPGAIRAAAFLIVSSVFLTTSNVQAQNATTVQLPTFGVAINADGVLEMKRAHDPTGRLHAARMRKAMGRLPADVWDKSDLRKVSLTRLEKQIRRKVDAGQPLDETMKNLAGLQRIQYVFCYPATGDIIIAGPAEGWTEDGVGRVRGATTFAPVLQLEDLCVALRAYPPASRATTAIGCSIDPSREGLARMQKFQASVPRVIPQNKRQETAFKMAIGSRKALGMATIRVFGVPERTNFAQVMVEADYRMKRIAIGLEPPPVKMVTYIGVLNGGTHGMAQRWWLTPDYDCVKLSEDHLAVEILGQGVQLNTQSNVIQADGELAPETRTPKAMKLYAGSFTDKYEAISKRAPVFAQLRNLVDMAVVAAHLQKEDYYGKTRWTPGLLLDESKLPVETLNTPKQVEPVVNVLWKGSRLLSPAGGGVSLYPLQALQQDHLVTDRDKKLASTRRTLRVVADEKRWWWD